MYSTATTAGRRTAVLLRVAVALQTACVMGQAVSIGIVFATDHGMAVHHTGSYVAYAAGMLNVLASVLVWRPGGGSTRWIRHSTAFLALASVQVVLGIHHVVGWHVPLGVLLFGMSVVQGALLWADRRS
ncbi:hypothetical protein BIV57_21015 [Mangrovactinospora gilvigrisea]|uniref:Integral membrane protein n=1 Tax=Mangrovactinospora gilvigrisea TaxID=1428644 RepID=A0A1J7C7C0_9ACTN|nr:hypothetical protein [Mangrovactinospora gilvigrisea]OIV35546.1 hypothetical protein BIV57_21015 [Mangrovactinospora gilvigrisea]